VNYRIVRKTVLGQCSCGEWVDILAMANSRCDDCSRKLWAKWDSEEVAKLCKHCGDALDVDITDEKTVVHRHCRPAYKASMKRKYATV